MITVAEARSKIAALLNITETETIPLAEASGRVLQKAVRAERDQPPFAASAMDGYAVRQADLAVGAELQVIGEIAAGHGSDAKITKGEAVRIFTGAPLPDGADYILIQEDAERNDDLIKVKEGFNTSSYVRPAGTDFQRGFEFDAPKRLNPFDLALLASMGAGQVDVSKPPVVAVIPTGDELVWPGESPRDDQIVASNNFGLKAMLEAEGAKVRLLPIAKDNAQALMAVFELAQDADLIVTLGGASVGDHDLVQDAATKEGLDLSFYKIAMRPGKPLMAGHLRGKPMIGLPGNPVSSLVCGHIFLRPAISAMLGLGYTDIATFDAILDIDLSPNGPREHFMRASVVGKDGEWHCTPHERQDSSLLTVLSSANALMIRTPNEKALKRGSVVKFTHI